MQSSNRYRQRADKHHHERRDRGENGRHNRSGKPDGHRHTRHPQQRHNHDDVLETIPATLAVDEEARVDDYIETWLRKTQESRAQRERDENEERQRTMPQKESPRAHLEVLRRKTTKKRARPIPNPAASLSGRSEHAEERFEKRARHKTLADKYEYRPDRGKKKHRAVEELEVAVNKPGKKKGMKGWRAQESEKELDEFSNFFHELDDKRGERRREQLQSSASLEGMLSHGASYGALRGGRDRRHSSTGLPQSAQSPPSGRRQGQGSKSGSYFTWSTSHYSDVGGEKHEDPTLPTTRGPSRSSARVVRSESSRDKQPRSSQRPPPPPHHHNERQRYKDAEVQADSRSEWAEAQSRAEYSQLERPRQLNPVGHNPHVPGRWVFIEESQPDPIFYHGSSYPRNGKERTTMAEPAMVVQSRTHTPVSYPGPAIPAYWKQASPPRPNYTLQYGQQRIRPAFDLRSTKRPFLLMGEDPTPHLPEPATALRIPHQPFRAEGESYLHGAEELQEFGDYQPPPRQSFQAPRHQEPLQSIQEAQEHQISHTWDTTPLSERPHIKALEEFIEKIEREAYSTHEYSVGDPGQDSGRADNGVEDNVMDAMGIPPDAGGAMDVQVDTQRDASSHPGLADMVWFDQ